MKRRAILLTLLLLLLVVQSASAMGSASYKLNWFTPATSGGGGLANSTHYAVNYSVGQSAIGASDSANYGGMLGFWYGIGAWIKNYVPLIHRDA
jgi:hypothetical protein